MATTLLLIVPLSLACCVHYEGADGTKFTSVGTKADRVKAGDLEIDKLDQDALAQGVKLVRDGIIITKGIDAVQDLSQPSADAIGEAISP